MKGVVFLGHRQVEVREIPEPKPQFGEVVLRMQASGLCGSDLYPYRAPLTAGTDVAHLRVRGHEPCGDVAELGPGVSGLKKGDRVMVHHYRGCNRCKYCRIGYTQMCGGIERRTLLYGTHLDGGHEDYMAVEASLCIPLPDALSYEEGAALACGSGTAYHALKRADVSGRDVVAVFGQGPVGLSATMFGSAMGARIIAIDIVPERLTMASASGAWATVNATETDPVKAVREATHGDGADVTLECTGDSTVRVQAVEAACPFGRVCFVGMRGTVTLEPTPHIIYKQLALYGSWTFSAVGLAEAASWVADRRIPVRNLITHTFPITDAAKAYRLLDEGHIGKPVIVWK